MAVFFECVQCDADFELDVADILRNPASVRCPNCGAKANQAIVKSAFEALDEFLMQARRLQTKFRVSLSLESDEVSGEAEEEDEAEEQEDVGDDGLWSDEVEEEEEDEEEED